MDSHQKSNPNIQRILKLLNTFSNKKSQQRIIEGISFEMRKLKSFRGIGLSILKYLQKNKGGKLETPKTLSEKKWGKKEYTPSYISNVVKNIYDGFKNSIISCFINNHNALASLAFTEMIRESGDNELYVQELEKALNSLQAIPDAGNSIEAMSHYLLMKNAYFSPSFNKFQEEAASYLDTIEQKLKEITFLEMIRLAIERIHLEQTTGSPKKDNSFTLSLIQDAETNQFFSSIELNLYCQYYRWLLDEEKSTAKLISFYDEFVNSVNASEEFRLVFLGHLINQFLRLLRKGDPVGRKYVNKLYVYGIDTKILLVNGVLPYGHFINAIMLNCDERFQLKDLKDDKLKDEAMMEQLIIDTAELLGKSEKENALKLAKKYLSFKLGKYKEARDAYINTYKNVGEEIRYRSIDLCCYYALGDLYFLESCPKYSVYLNNMQEGASTLKLNAKQIANNLEHIKILKKMWKLREQLVVAEDENQPKVESRLIIEVQQLIAFLEDFDNVVIQRDWLIDQCSKLLEIDQGSVL